MEPVGGYPIESQSKGVPRDGAAGKLEGLFAAFAGGLSGRLVSSDIGDRKGLFQPDQREHRTPHQVRQGRRRDLRGGVQRGRHQGLQG
jgi:hypothetical protein